MIPLISCVRRRIGRALVGVEVLQALGLDPCRLLLLDLLQLGFQRPLLGVVADLLVVELGRTFRRLLLLQLVP